MNEYKVEKLPIIASYTCNFISKLLQGGKNMMAFCTTIQRLPLIVLCRQSQLWVNFKIKSVLFLSPQHAMRRKIKF